MRIVLILTLAAALINLTACSSMRGNVVPQSGPTMEQVYDGVDEQNNLSNEDTLSNQEKLKKFHRQNTVPQIIQTAQVSSLSAQVAPNAVSQQFRRLPNPEIKLYVFPHLAGQDQVPIPGYFTAFSVYAHDYYALPQE